MTSETTTLTGDGIPIRIGRLATIKDGTGSIRVGWVHDGAMYVQAKGSVGRWVCSEYTSRLACEIKSRLGIHIYFDLTGARAFAPGCRMMIARALFLGRKRIGPITVLVKSLTTAKVLTTLAFLLRVPLLATNRRRVFWSRVMRPRSGSIAPPAPESRL